MKYQHLDNLIGAYFNQDYSIRADSIEGLIHAYRTDATAMQRKLVLTDIAAFVADHPTGLDTAFDSAFGSDFDPRLWQHTALTFLTALDRGLRDR
jgi:tRNA U34 5-methylaminomethyl-2-thiouridine-forming methyltransferase MnmC